VDSKRSSAIATAAGLIAGAAVTRAITIRADRAPQFDHDAAAAKPDAVKPLADDLDKELLEQLHAATLQASDSCFEIKKLCATALIPTGALVALFSDRRVGPAVFVSGLLVITFFWLADAVGYYYQRKLRATMGDVWLRRSQRCSEAWDSPKTTKTSPLRAAFNGSMYFYLLLAIPVVVGLILYAMGVIESPRKVTP
jgi:hypothetical protein